MKYYFLFICHKQWVYNMRRKPICGLSIYLNGSCLGGASLGRCHIFNSTRFLDTKFAVIIAYGIRAREQSAEVQIYWKLKDRINTFHYYSAICLSITSQYRPVGRCWDLQEDIKCSPLSQHCNYMPSAPQLPYKHIITFILLSFNYPPLSPLLPRIPRGLLSASVYKFLSYFRICRTSVKGVEENSWVWNDALQKGLSQQLSAAPIHSSRMCWNKNILSRCGGRDDWRECVYGCFFNFRHFYFPGGWFLLKLAVFNFFIFVISRPH